MNTYSSRVHSKLREKREKEREKRRHSKITNKRNQSSGLCQSEYLKSYGSIDLDENGDENLLQKTMLENLTSPIPEQTSVMHF